MKIYAIITSCGSCVELVQVFQKQADAVQAYRQQQRLTLVSEGLRTMQQANEMDDNALADALWDEYYDGAEDWGDRSDEPVAISWYATELQ